MKKKIVYGIYILSLLTIGITQKMFFSKKDKEVRVETVLETKKWEKEGIKKYTSDKKLDINKADYELLRHRKISTIATKKILDYREKIGTVEELERLIFLKGIGIKTVEKLKENFFVEKNVSGKFKRVNINSVKVEFLGVMGLDKKTIKKLLKLRERGIKIYSNVELIDMMSGGEYEMIRGRIKYDDY